jgi:hypothetical protein
LVPALPEAFDLAFQVPSMSRENVIAKAQRYLTEARVRILFCDEDNGVVAADVRGSGASYSTGRDDEQGWYCNCSARGECAHIAALKFVTVMEPRS